MASGEDEDGPALDDAADGSPAHSPSAESTLAQGEIEIRSRALDASNLTLLCEHETLGACIYKPISGEQPLWDFTEGHLAWRERASYLISRALKWHQIPTTVVRDGPLGPGMVQAFVEQDATRRAVRLRDLAGSPEIESGEVSVLEALDGDDRLVRMVHDDHPRLLRLALLDVVINNADRKGSHVLMTGEGVYIGIDHGVSLHAEEKLRTVLWGWSGQAIPDELLRDLADLADELHRDAPSDEGLSELHELLAVRELSGLRQRVATLIDTARMPSMPMSWSSIPWPPL